MNGVHIDDDEIHPDWRATPELKAAAERAQKVVNESDDTLEVIAAARELLRLKAEMIRRGGIDA